MSWTSDNFRVGDGLSSAPLLALGTSLMLFYCCCTLTCVPGKGYFLSLRAPGSPIQVRLNDVTDVSAVAYCYGAHIDVASQPVRPYQNNK